MNICFLSVLVNIIYTNGVHDKLCSFKCSQWDFSAVFKNLLYLVPFRHGERIAFSYLVSQKYTEENVFVKVLRNSKVLEFNIKLSAHRRLIPAHIKAKPPSYYIIAGFVFTVVSVPYLRSEVLFYFDIENPLLVFFFKIKKNISGAFLFNLTAHHIIRLSVNDF